MHQWPPTGVTEQEMWEAGEDPTAFIAKYGMDRWIHVGQMVYNAVQPHPPSPAILDGLKRAGV